MVWSQERRSKAARYAPAVAMCISIEQDLY
jgi:hypothetical protein